MSNRIYLLIILLNSCIYLCSQGLNKERFLHFTTKDGLSDNYITSIQQDETGNIWIGTEVGLNKYDGNSFENINQQLYDHGVSTNIGLLKKFNSNELGILCRNGFYTFDTKNFVFKKFIIPDSTSFSAYLNYTWDAQLISKNSYAVTSATGFYVFNADGTLKFRYDGYSKNDIGSRTIRYGKNIIPVNDSEYLVYFAVNNFPHIIKTGVAYYNSLNNEYRPINTNESYWKQFTFTSGTTGSQWVTKFKLSKSEYFFISADIDSIFYYNHNSQTIVSSYLPFHTANELNYESKITMINDTTFVLNGGNDGFWKFNFDRKTGLVYGGMEKYLSEFKINCLFVDREERLWAGTSNGILQERLIDPFLKVYSLTKDAVHDKDQKNLMCAYRYKDKLYLGRLARSSGLVILDTASMKPIKTIDLFGKNNSYNELWSIEMYHPDTLWLGSTAGLIWLDTKSYNYGKVAGVRNLSAGMGQLAILSPQTKNGLAWISSYMAGTAIQYNVATRSIIPFTGKTIPKIPFEQIKKIVVDAYGNAWFSGHSLARWNSETSKFDTLMQTYGGPKKYNDNILNIVADEHGSLWLHNVENGLLEYKIKERKFQHYGMSDGMPSENIESISPVKDNIIWLAHRNNLSCFDLSSRKIISSYNYSDGFPQHKPTSFYIYLDSLNNSCYLLSQNDIIKFPFVPLKYSSNDNELFIKNIIVNNNKTIYNTQKKIQFKAYENNLVINYTTIDFESGSNYKFAYRLDDDSKWISLGDERTLTLTNLNPGKYKITFKAIAKSGNTKLAEFSFQIHPPFWKTAWFISLFTLIIVSFFYFLYRRRIRQLKQKNDLDRLIAKTQMKALHAQMNPHFVFNSLNSIREMILNNENAEASHYLRKFAQLVRISLDQSENSLVTLRNTIDYLERYIEMEKVRNSHFTFTLKVSNELSVDETLLPPMLIQPFIENSIWHSNIDKNKIVNIEIELNSDTDLNGMNRLICKIEDDGIGIDHSLAIKSEFNSESKPIGISNVQQRIRLLTEKYGLKSEIVIKDRSTLPGENKTGTLVILYLPLEIPEE